MLDQYLFGATSRISPEAPVPVVHVRETDDRPGGAANVAVNLAALGANTALIGVVGEDAAGKSLADIMAGRGIQCSFTVVNDRPTITKTRVQSRGQQLIRLDQENAAALGDNALTETLRTAVASTGAATTRAKGVILIDIFPR